MRILPLEQLPLHCDFYHKNDTSGKFGIVELPRRLHAKIGDIVVNCHQFHKFNPYSLFKVVSVKNNGYYDLESCESAGNIFYDVQSSFFVLYSEFFNHIVERFGSEHIAATEIINKLTIQVEILKEVLQTQKLTVITEKQLEELK